MMANQVSLFCLWIVVSVTSETYGMRRCTHKEQYYDEASDSCASCAQLCYLHKIQGTTQTCREKCWAYYQGMSTPPAPTSLPPTQTSTQASDVMNAETRIYLIVGAIFALIFIVAIAFACRKKMRRCRRCPPGPKPPGTPTDPPDPRHPQECSLTQAVQPQSDPQDRSAVYMSPLQTAPDSLADATQTDQDGAGETTQMLPPQPGASTSIRMVDETQ